MEMKPVVRLSVRAVVETTLFEPNLMPAAGLMERMREGAAAHQARQETGKATERDYEAEVSLAADYETDEIILHVTGRADAIFESGDGPVIEELKLGVAGSELNPAHMAQAEMYGHMFCRAQGIGHIRLMVRYVNTAGEVLEDYLRECTADELAARFDELCQPAAVRALQTVRREQVRNLSIEALRFPFPSYRAGQKTFSTAVYAAIRDRKRLFAQAPTGIGKTMAALYPAVHALGQGKCAGILFLSARGTGRRVAIEAARQLKDAGAALYAVEIMAKAKACPLEMQDCRPEACARACGFFTRLPDALTEAMDGGLWDSQRIAGLAEKYTLCPFELSLEMAKQADLIICDVNYVYDPVVAIDAFLSRRGGMTILVDEAHRLCERVKDDYSVQLRMQDVRELRRETGKQIGRRSGTYLALSAVINGLKDLEQGRQPALPAGNTREGSADGTAPDVPWQPLSGAMQQLLEAAGGALREQRAAALVDAMGMALDWLYTAERFSERYAFLTDGTGDRFEAGLHLMDAAPEILAVSRRARGCIYFSATLAPIPASMRLLGSMPGDLTMVLPTPFSPDALSVEIVPLDVRYQARQSNAGRLARIIESFLTDHPGNSMVFFPSYAFMEMVAGCFDGAKMLGGKRLVFESRGMSEADRAQILGLFSQDGNEDIALLCVLGGSFSEGIDLPGSRLQNAAVISTGLPVMDARIRAMQAYYRERGEDGFFYTMTLPGMIRVIQAAGRLIRTETDTGSLLLVDSRYNSRQIQTLLESSLIGAAISRGRQRDANQ